MGWIKLTGAVPSTNKVLISCSAQNSHGRARVTVTIPSAVAGKEWDKADRVDVLIGEDEFTGKAMVTPAGDGAFGMGRRKTALVIRFPAPNGGPAQKQEKRACEFERDGVSFVLHLPRWMTVPDIAKPFPKIDDVNHDRLAMAGQVFVCGKHNISLAKPQADFMQRLITANGERVTAQRAELDLGTKALDSPIAKLNKMIALTGYGIYGDRGKGYVLRTSQS